MPVWFKTLFGLLGGLAIFIYGMNLMSEKLQKVAGSRMKKVLEVFTKNPVLGVLSGALVTAVLQSSSATIAVLQNLASQAGIDGNSIIGLKGSIPVLLGDNIGTTITALLACIGQSRDSKRTAVAHTLFNVSGTLIFIFLVTPYSQFIQWMSPKGDEVAVISRQIANAHTIFNITMSLIWLPLLPLMVKIVKKIVPDSKKVPQDQAEFRINSTELKEVLNFRLLNNPDSAIAVAKARIEKKLRKLQ